ncbi:MAG TPA: hypothetical protein VFP94_00870, partial [Terriglobales bacterium]|nr:hypothetical protein [Terriglobales bacterium]
MAAAYLIVSSSRFQRWAARKAENAASQALGTPVHIAHLRLRGFSLSPSADVTAFSIAGRGPAAAPPLLTVDHAHIAVRVTSLWRRTWQLENVELDHPVVHLRVAADGSTNLPQPPPGGGHGPGIFQLGIRHFEVRKGEVFINDRQASLAADLRSLALNATFDPATERYSGGLAYQQGSLTWDNHASLPHSLSLAFDAGRDGLKIPRLSLSSDVLNITASAAMPSFSPPQADVQYHMQLSSAGLRPLVGERNLPRGTVAVEGTAAWRDHHFTTQGRFTSSEVVTTAAALSVPVRNFSGQYQLSDRDLTVTGISAAVLGGSLRADAAVHDVGGRNQGSFHARLSGAQLERIARLAPSGGHTLGELGISGTLEGAISGEWQGRFDTLVLQTQASLQGSVQRSPVTASLNAVYDAQRRLLTLSDTKLETAGLNLAANGTLAAGGAGAIALQAASPNLGQAEALAARLATSLGRPLPPLGLSGQASFRGSVAGPLEAPHIAGHLQAAPLTVRGVSWRSLAADVNAAPGQVRLENVRVLAGEQGRITLTASLGLAAWKPSAASAIAGSVTASHFALDQLAPLVPGRMPLTGILNAHAALSGTLAAPQGDATLTVSRAHLHLGGRDELGAGLESFSVTAHGASGVITLDASAQLLSGPVAAHGSFDYRSHSYSGELHADELVLDRLPALTQRRLPIAGVVTLHGSGQGTIAAPSFQLTATAPQLTIAGQTITGLQLDARLQNRSVHAGFAATALKTALTAQADVGWGGAWPIEARLDAPAIPIAPLLVAFAPQQAEGVHGQTELHATLSGPLARPEDFHAEVTFPTLALAYGRVLRLQAAQPIQARLDQGVVTLQPAHLTG